MRTHIGKPVILVGIALQRLTDMMSVIYEFCLHSWAYNLFEQYVVSLQTLGQYHGLLIVHIIVECAVNEQIFLAAQILGACAQPGLGVAQLIGFGQAHVTLRVNGI